MESKEEVRRRVGRSTTENERGARWRMRGENEGGARLRVRDQQCGE